MGVGVCGKTEVRLHPAVLELERMAGDREGFLSFLREWARYSWRWAGEERYRLVFRVEAAALRAMREYLDSHGFTEVLAPIVGPVTDPGIRGAKQATIDFYGYEYKVMSSAILYKQYMAASLGRMYFLAPNIRLEPLDSAFTGRHLAEFYQLDLEIRDASYEDAMRVAEELLYHVVKRVAEEYGRELEDTLGRSLEPRRPPYRRLRYEEAVRLARELGCRQPMGAEIRWECEKLLSAYMREPFFIVEYPRGARGFYDREDPSRPGVLLDFDLIYPEGFGEAASGAEREYEPARIVARMRESGEDPAKYRWYLEMLRELYPLRTAGFGIGVERLTRYLCGLRGVWEARPYPKIPGIAPTP
ncbi:MAG: asparagine synthetase A [Desulfurococcales archaeon]|nr:asparagine synthetase A [Desulfurococcales archaeon]